MKSDREFLNGVYSKAEELSSNCEALSNLEKQKHTQIDDRSTHNKYVRHVRYTAIAASFLLLASLTVYQAFIVRKGETNYIDTPSPINYRLVDYVDQIFDQSTDIIEVSAIKESDRVSLELGRVVKGSGSELALSAGLNHDQLMMDAGQTAIIFLQIEADQVQILDKFLLNEEDNSYINSYHEVITSQRLDEFLRNNK